MLKQFFVSAGAIGLGVAVAAAAGCSLTVGPGTSSGVGGSGSATSANNAQSSATNAASSSSASASSATSSSATSSSAASGSGGMGAASSSAAMSSSSTGMCMDMAGCGACSSCWNPPNKAGCGEPQGQVAMSLCACNGNGMTTDSFDLYKSLYDCLCGNDGMSGACGDKCAVNCTGQGMQDNNACYGCVGVAIGPNGTCEMRSQDCINDK